MLTWRLSGLSVCNKWSRHASKERATLDEGTTPEECMMRGYKGRKELQKWWEHVLSCYLQICNTRSKAVHLWKKVTGSISWRNYFKTKNVWTDSLLYYAVFSWKKGWKCSAMRKSRSWIIFLFVCLFFVF